MSNITTAMLFAAGYGKRLRPITNQTPKPLVTVAGKTLLAWNINYLIAGGIKKIIINTHYLANLINEFIRNNKFDAEIVISPEPVLLDQAGGVKAALKHFGNQQQLLLLNSDGIFIDDNCNNVVHELVNQSEQADRSIRIVTYSINKLTNIKMPPDLSLNPLKYTKSQNGTHVYTGLMTIDRDYITAVDSEVAPLGPILKDNARKTKAIEYQGKWFHVSDPESYQKANEILSN